MPIEHGIGLFFLGTTLTIIGFFIAFHFATRKKSDSEKISDPLKELLTKK